MKPRDRLKRLIYRPPYLPRPTREEIVGAALSALHSDLTAIMSRRAVLEGS